VREITAYPIERWLYLLSNRRVFRGVHNLALAIMVASGEKDPWEVVKEPNHFVNALGGPIGCAVCMPLIFFEAQRGLYILHLSRFKR